MKVTRFSLYIGLNSKIATDYSRLKFGDRRILIKFAQQLANIIKKESKQYGNYVIYATNKYPMNRFCRKDSFLLAAQVAKILRRPLLVGLYKYRYKRISFADNQIYKRILNGLPVIENKRLLKKRHYHVVMIDDSIISGKSLRASLKELRNVTRSVSFFSIIKLGRGRYSENQINNFIITHSNKVDKLLSIIKQNGYIFTSHAMRTIDELTSNEKQKLIAKINIKELHKLQKAFQIYFERKFSIPRTNRSWVDKKGAFEVG